jgi:peptide/nickel transport system permease protein
MAAFLIRRLIQLVVVILAVSTLLFFLLRLSGDPALLLLGDNVDSASLARMRATLGLDQPVYIQYLRFIGNLLRLDFGQSITARQDAMPLVLARFPYTLVLTAVAIVLSVAAAVPLGMLAAYRPKSTGARLGMALTFIGQAMPVFWLGLLLVQVLSIGLGWLPSSGSGEWKHLVLPAVALAAFQLAKLARLTRAAMLEVLGTDYVRTAHAKGLTSSLVLRRHAVRNALIPVVTILGVDIGQLLGGAVITETIFAWPGLGQQLIQAVATRDYPVVQASVFLVALLAVGISFAVELSHRLIDPRLRAA